MLPRRFHHEVGLKEKLGRVLLVVLIGLDCVWAGCDSKDSTLPVGPSSASDRSAEVSRPASDNARSNTSKSETPQFFGQTWKIHGTAVDSENQLVKEIDAAAIWSSNGVFWNEEGAIPEEEIANVWKREGTLAVRPQYAASTTSTGDFTLTVEDRPRAPVLAVNTKRSHGGLILVEREDADRPIKIELSPLVRVTAEVYCPEAKRSPDFVKAEVYVRGGDNMPLTQCGSYRGKLSFLLPPGDYEINARGESPTASLRVKQRPDNVPLYGVYQRGESFTVPTGVDHLDLGILTLELPQNAEGDAVDITQYYGKTPPDLDAVAGLRVPSDLKLSGLRGKWVLIEFWALWCAPCVSDELPSLNQFYAKHAHQRDQFEILAICDTTSENIKTIGELEPRLFELRETAWNGRSLSIPILLDNGSRTAARYGIASRPTSFLIGPDGKLVETFPEDALQFLARQLKETGSESAVD